MDVPRHGPAPAFDAATLLLVRDAPRGLEVFMQVRSRRLDFAVGAMVFPGGRVDPVDADPRLRDRAGATLSSVEPRGFALRVAAIRELFEESGILLARTRGADRFVTAERLRDLTERHHAALRAGRTALADLLESEDLELACDALVPFAHWITPELMPKRFDTHFFLAEAPAGQVGTHDGSESVDSAWVTPADALAEARAGRRTVIFPTRLNLEKLGRSRTAAEAIETARASRIVTVMPRVEQRESGPVLCIPEQAGYDVVEAPLDALRG